MQTSVDNKTGVKSERKTERERGGRKALTDGGRNREREEE